MYSSNIAEKKGYRINYYIIKLMLLYVIYNSAENNAIVSVTSTIAPENIAFTKMLLNRLYSGFREL